jgi:hypothetical protein
MRYYYFGSRSVVSCAVGFLLFIIPSFRACQRLLPLDPPALTEDLFCAVCTNIVLVV